MPNVQIQNVLQAHATSNATVLTISQHFTANTTPGNLQILVAGSQAYNTSSFSASPAISTPTTSGTAWTLLTAVTAAPVLVGANWTGIALSFYYLPNTPLVASTTSTSITASLAVAANTFQLGFGMIEYSGPPAVNPAVLTAAATGLYPTQPGVGNIVVTPTNALVLASETDANGGQSVVLGNGFSAVQGGGTSHFVTYGILNATPGTYTTTFSGLPASYNWCCIVGVFGTSGAAASSFMTQPILIGF